MARGDNARVWFPEMIEELRGCWTADMSWDELAEFCARMTTRRDEIRRANGYGPRRMRCRGCGQMATFSMSAISIRSALFALENNGIISEAQLNTLDARWKQHRARHGLDRFGRERDAVAADRSIAGLRCGCSSSTSTGATAGVKLANDPTLTALLDRVEPVASTAQHRLVGRNDACPCGSGKKYKRCCSGGGRQSPPDGAAGSS